MKQIDITSMTDPTALEKAVRSMKNGKVIAFYMLGVCGILGDGANAITWQEIIRIKEGHKVRAHIQRHSNVTEMDIIDTDKIHPSIARLVKNDPTKLETLVGGKAHMLYPIKYTALERVPENMRSYSKLHGYQVQIFESTGTNLEQLIDKLFLNGIQFPVVTSLNVVNKGTITNMQEGIDFSQTKGGIPQFLVGQSSLREGSFGRIHAVDLSVLREGPELQFVLNEITAYQDF